MRWDGEGIWIWQHHRVALSCSLVIMLPNPKLFGIHKLEGGNPLSDLSHVLLFSVMVYGNFSRNPVARSPVIKVFWAQGRQSWTTSELFITDSWGSLSYRFLHTCHESFHAYGWRPVMLPTRSVSERSWNFVWVFIMPTIKSTLQFFPLYFSCKKKTLGLQIYIYILK